MQRLIKMPRVKVVSGAEEDVLPAMMDRLIIQMFPRPNSTMSCAAVKLLAASAQRITLITAGDRSRFRRTAFQMQWRELKAFGRWLGRIDRIVYKDGFYPFDLFALFKSRRVFGFYTHSMFMDNEDTFEYIQRLDWETEATRPNLINFIGSQDPAPRKRILDSIRELFNQPAQTFELKSPPKNSVWHEYSDAKPAALGLVEFVDVLSNSDFTLCPPGYSLITHRVIEGLLRGSIPVLHANELDIYDIGLTNGINCIAVSPGAWPAAIERCFRMDENTIRAMRRNARSLAEQRLLYPVSSRQMRQRLGFDGE
jgi:hypothetical protein